MLSFDQQRQRLPIFKVYFLIKCTILKLTLYTVYLEYTVMFFANSSVAYYVVFWNFAVHYRSLWKFWRLLIYRKKHMRFNFFLFNYFIELFLIIIFFLKLFTCPYTFSFFLSFSFLYIFFIIFKLFVNIN